jgi:hypothetical protein
VIIAGTYQDLAGRKEFWCTHFKENTFVLDLSPEQPITEWIARLAA